MPAPTVAQVQSDRAGAMPRNLPCGRYDRFRLPRSGRKKTSTYSSLSRRERPGEGQQNAEVIFRPFRRPRQSTVVTARKQRTRCWPPPTTASKSSRSGRLGVGSRVGPACAYAHTYTSGAGRSRNRAIRLLGQFDDFLAHAGDQLDAAGTVRRLSLPVAGAETYPSAV